MLIGLSIIAFLPALILLALTIEEYLEVRQLVSKGTRTSAEVTNMTKFEVQDEWFSGDEPRFDGTSYSHEYFLQYHDQNNQLKKISVTDISRFPAIGCKIDIIHYLHYFRVASFKYLYGRLTCLILATVGLVVFGFYILENLGSAII